MRGFHIPIWQKMTAKIKKVKMPDLSLRVKIMLYIAALACAVLSIVSITCGGIFPPAAEYAVYTAAGVTLFLSCFYLAGSLVLLKQKIMGLARSNTLTARLTDDIEYRSVLFAVCGVCMNIVFALFNGIAGWMSRSAWFGTLSAYYLILGMMRAYWIFHNRNKVRNRENQRSSRAPPEKYMALLRRPVPLPGSRPLRGGHPACESGGRQDVPGVDDLRGSRLFVYEDHIGSSSCHPGEEEERTVVDHDQGYRTGRCFGVNPDTADSDVCGIFRR